MLKILFLAAAAALVGLSAAKATEYEFSFSGSGYTASGEFAVLAGSTGPITTITGTSTLGGVTSNIASNLSVTHLDSYTAPTNFHITLGYNDSLGNTFVWLFAPGVGTDARGEEGLVSVTLSGKGIGDEQIAYGTINPAPLPAPGAGLLSFSFLAAAGLWPRIKGFAGSALGGKRPRAARA